MQFTIATGRRLQSHVPERYKLEELNLRDSNKSRSTIGGFHTIANLQIILQLSKRTATVFSLSPLFHLLSFWFSSLLHMSLSFLLFFVKTPLRRRGVEWNEDGAAPKVIEGSEDDFTDR
jgi:hypothetical protein